MSEERGTQIKRLILEIEELQSEYYDRHFDQKVIKKFIQTKYNIEVTERTIQRDIQLLLDMGFIEKASQSKKNLKYSLNPKQLKLKQIKSDSLYTIFYFLKYLDQYESTSLRQKVGELKSRILDNVRDADSAMVRKLEERLHLRSLGVPDGIKFDAFHKIIEALPTSESSDGSGTGKVLVFRDKADPSRERELEPHFVFISDYSLKVVGRLREKSDSAAYQRQHYVVIPVSSMESLSVSKQTWQSQLLTYENYFKDSFGTNREPHISKPQTITLRFAPKVASLIYDIKWHHTEKKNKTEKGGLDLSMIVKVEMDLIRWVVSFGKDVSIVEGEELRSAVKSYLNEALLQYENN